MQIKRFYASSLPAAVRIVRKTLGPDAVILSTRHLSTEDARVLVNVGNAKVEVTAARETPESVPLPPLAQPPLQAPSRVTLARKGNGGPKPVSLVPESLARYANQASEFPPAESNNRTGGMSKEMRALLRELRSLSAELAKPADKPRRFSDSRREISRTAFSMPSGQEKRPASSGFSPDGSEGPLWLPPTEKLSSDSLLPASKLLERLREQGVDEALIQRIIGRMYCASRRVEAAPWRPGKPGSVDENTEGTFDRFVRVVGDYLVRPNPQKAPGAGPRKIALAGPTGVGKTTTIAKIAAHHALRENKSVALITLDTYRIAAAEQLKTYARLLGVPVEVVSAREKLGEVLERFGRADLVLIDTPGYSPGDRSAILRLGELLSRHSCIETHLVVPSALRLTEMRRAMEAFRPLRFERVIFSKLDETVSWGNLLNAWILDGLEVSYFTLGQRVPEDLEPASLERLCRTLLSAELAPAAG